MSDERLAYYMEHPGSTGLLLKHRNGEAARLVLMKAADHIYERTGYGQKEDEADYEAIDLLDGIRDGMRLQPLPQGVPCLSPLSEHQDGCVCRECID